MKIKVNLLWLEIKIEDYKCCYILKYKAVGD